MELGILIGQLLLKYGPDLVAKFVAIIHADKEPTAEDWQKLLDQASGKSYDDYLAEAQKR